MQCNVKMGTVKASVRPLTTSCCMTKAETLEKEGKWTDYENRAVRQIKAQVCDQCMFSDEYIYSNINFNVCVSITYATSWWSYMYRVRRFEILILAL